MPILNVEVVGPVEKDLAQQVADATGVIFESERGHTWVKMRLLDASHYAENGVTGSHPVFVSVLLGRSQAVQERTIIAKKLAETIAQILERPRENIHILFEPDGVGRIAFGGVLLTD